MMIWKYKIGKQDNLYAVFEYFTDEDGKEQGWTEEPYGAWYKSKKELVEDLKRMLSDLEDTSHFEY